MSLPQEYIEELNVLNRKVAQDQPADVIEYCADYFNNKLNSRRNQPFRNASFSQNSGAPIFKSPFASNDPHVTLSEDPHSSSGYISKSTNEQAPHANNKHIPDTFNLLRRSSVSAETMNPDSFHNDSWKPPVHDLTPDQLSRLNKSIVKNFLFSNLDELALSTVLHALQEKRYEKDSLIIKQGDEGDFFYLIEKGEVEYIVSGNLVSSAGAGASFGELALMYYSPRAATVRARTDVIVWALDRLTFRRILLEVTAKKRLMYEEFLKSVKILSGLSSYQRSKLADALHTELYKPDQIIIKEGDIGENFYLIESGQAEILKGEEGVINVISKGDYFGEIALLNDLPRQATVKAKSHVRVATLGKSGFQRLLGPVVDVLKAQDPRK